MNNLLPCAWYYHHKKAMSTCFLVGEHKMPVNQHSSTIFPFSSVVWGESVGNIVVPGWWFSPVVQTYWRHQSGFWIWPCTLSSTCLFLVFPCKVKAHSDESWCNEKGMLWPLWNDPNELSHLYTSKQCPMWTLVQTRAPQNKPCFPFRAVIKASPFFCERFLHSIAVDTKNLSRSFWSPSISH